MTLHQTTNPGNLTQPFPSMYWLEIQDLMFLKIYPSDNCDIFSQISFVASCTRASSSKKLKHNFRRSSSTKHFYFNRIVYLWNALPPIDISQSYSSIKRQITNFLRDHFTANFNPDHSCTYCITSFAPVPPALTLPTNQPTVSFISYINQIFKL